MKIKNEVKIFDHDLFGQLEILLKDNKEYFGAIDAAVKLGYSNPFDAIIRHCRNDGVVFHEVIDSIGRLQQKKYISEGNLYRLIARSKLPEAEAFEIWVFDEVLPTIRETGGYVGNDDLFIQTYLPGADEQTKALFKTTLQTLKAQSLQVNDMKPKAIFADAVQASKTSILIGELAKIIQSNGVDMGQNRLFQWLRNNGFLIKRGMNYNLPTQKAMSQGLFEVHKRVIKKKNGLNETVNTTKVTGKGQVYFINRFLEEKDKEIF